MGYYIGYNTPINKHTGEIHEHIKRNRKLTKTIKNIRCS